MNWPMVKLLSEGALPIAPFARKVWFVGDNAPSGVNLARSLTDLFSTRTMQSGDIAFIGPGQYDEVGVITIPRALSNIMIIGTGGRGAAYIQPTTEDQGGLVVHADDVTIVNLGIAAEDASSASALIVSGSRFRAYQCKIEQGLYQLTLGPGTVAQKAAGTYGSGADCLFEDCEFAWGTNGVLLRASDYGGVTQAHFRRCKFHNLSTSSFEESDGTGGSAAVHFFNLLIEECVFDPAEDGTIPTKWISLNDNNANTGQVTRCSFPTAINSGKNLISTKGLWIGNFHTGGVAAAQPS